MVRSSCGTRRRASFRDGAARRLLSGAKPSAADRGGPGARRRRPSFGRPLRPAQKSGGLRLGAGAIGHSCERCPRSTTRSGHERFQRGESQPHHRRTRPPTLRPAVPRRTVARRHRRGGRTDATEDVRGHSSHLRRQEVRDRRTDLRTTPKTRPRAATTRAGTVRGSCSEQPRGAQRRSSCGAAMAAVCGGRR